MKKSSTLQISYREILTRTLNERLQANPRYSLRAFARDLGVSPSALSLVFSGKKGLSPKAAEQISRRLGLSSDEAARFKTSVSAGHARSRLARRAAAAQLTEMERTFAVTSLQLDAFRIVADWHHFALLELTHLKSFREEPEWIGAQLGIHPDEAVNAISRLLRVELLSRNAKGRLQAADRTLVPGGVPSEAIRKFHRQVLEKALAAISLQSIDDRHLNTSFLPIRRSEMGEATNAIKKFHQDFVDRFAAGTRGDAVYAMSLQFFDLTPKLKPKALIEPSLPGEEP